MVCVPDHQIMKIAGRAIILVAFAGAAPTSRAQNAAAWSLVDLQRPPGLDSHAMAYDSLRGEVVLLGGWNGHGQSAETWVWNGDQWRLASTEGPAARTDHAMVFDAQRGVVVLFGGRVGQYRNDETWTWDGVKWTPAVRFGLHSPLPRHSAAMAFDSTRNLVYLHGGSGNSHNLDDFWVWDGVQWTEVLDQGGTTPGERADHAMVYDSARDRLVLFGGNADSSIRAKTYEWDGGAWEVVADGAPAPRFGHTMVFDSSRHHAVMFGGFLSSNDVNETWTWDGVQWSLLSAEGPSARHSHAAAFDSRRDVMLLHGGTDGANETWEWDGRGWSARLLHPGARESLEMVHHAARAITALVGGAGRGEVFGDTWRWTGSQWVGEEQPGPGARQAYAMTYDSNRGVVVLFGGSAPGGLKLGDTWEWDGDEWSLVSESGPAPRVFHAMAYDEARRATVLFGGQTQAGRIGDTWEWDGVRWRQIMADGPFAREAHAMTYDRHNAVVLLFGGHAGGTSALNDLWMWDGELWQNVPQARHAAGAWPLAGSAHRIVYDTARDVTILASSFQGSGRFNSGSWEWNGVAWNQIAEVGPVVSNYALAFDPIENQCVLFGGLVEGGSTDATWTLAYATTFVSQPNHTRVGPGAPAAFQVEVLGGGERRYQWRRDRLTLYDDGRISGARSSTLTIRDASVDDAGRYDCVISTDDGDILCRSVRLDVVGPSLLADATCPEGGPIQVSWSNATPDGQIALIFAASPGVFRIPGSFECAGTMLGLGPAQIQLAYAGSAGADGARTIHSGAGPNACGGSLQLLDLSTCATSNVVLIE